MAFTLIKGTFHVVGYSPDGDSVRFKADNEANWAKLSGAPVQLNARRHAQLRLEAIDTLETHYGKPPMHQPLELATKALGRYYSGWPLQMFTGMSPEPKSSRQMMAPRDTF